VRLIWRRPATRILFGLFALLILVATVLSGLRQQREREQQIGYQKLVREQWMAQPDRNPHRVAHYGTFVFRPRERLAGFELGLESYGGRMQFLEAHKQNSANFADAGTLSAAFRLGELSPGFVVELVLALVILILGHGVFAAEVESGRVGLLRAQLGERFGVLWLGKVAGLFLAVLPFLGLCLLVLFGVACGGEISELLRAGILGVCLVAYAVSWVAVVCAVSVFCKSSQQALVWCLGLWLFSGVLVPRLAAGTAVLWHPLPNRSEFQARLGRELVKLGDSHNANDPIYVALKEEALRKHGVQRVEDLPFNFKATVLAEGEKNSAQVYAQELETWQQVQRKQGAVLRYMGWLSPAIAWRDLSMRLCGSDLGAQQRFTQDAEHYRYHFVQKLNGLQHKHTDYEGKRAVRISSEYFDEIADFHPTPYSLRLAMKNSTTSFLGIGLWGAVAFLAGRRKLK
jgi:ABC-2 type transport system permease protein